MVYQGSKNRLSKKIVPILQRYIDDNNIETYIEPFGGGATLPTRFNARIEFAMTSTKTLYAC